MSAGDITPAVRRPDGTQPHELEPGEYALSNAEAKAVWICFPDGVHGGVTADRWTITVNSDDTVTIDPSIWVNKPSGWHGYLVGGEWREV